MEALYVTTMLCDIKLAPMVRRVCCAQIIVVKCTELHLFRIWHYIGKELRTCGKNRSLKF